MLLFCLLDLTYVHLIRGTSFVSRKLAARESENIVVEFLVFEIQEGKLEGSGVESK